MDSGPDRTNWIGFYTLYVREVRRFIAVVAQTIGGPVVASLLLLIVFGAALESRAPGPTGASYLTFIAPGLVMMGIAQNAFANTSSSLLVAKLQGNIVDLLVAPLSSAEFLAGLALGGITRGLLVGALTMMAIWPFVPIPMPSVAATLFYGVGGALLFALLGLVTGLWARRMDDQAAVTSFIVIPLTLLSGTFFAVGSLPPPFREIALLDPVFYIVDGFRGGMAGVAEAHELVGVGVVLGFNVAMVLVCHRLLAIGWRLRQ
jgi:ABC-2 type transport system permease protein